MPTESEALAGLINSGTKEIQKTDLKRLINQHQSHLDAHGVEHPEVLAERSRLMEIEQREKADQKSLDNVMSSVQLTNDVEAKRLEFKDETTQYAFHLALKEFGSERTMQALELHGNNPYQALARLRGFPDFISMQQEMAHNEKVFIEKLDKQQ